MITKLLSFLIPLALLFPSQAITQPQQDYFPNRLIIKYESDQELQQIQSKTGDNPQAAVQQLLSQNGMQFSKPLLSNRMQQAVKARNLPSSSDITRIKEVIFGQKINPKQLAAKLSRMPGVAYAEPKYIRYMDDIPNDQEIEKYVTAHNFDDAWDLSTGSRDIVIAIVDGGVNYEHSELDNNLWINQDEVPATIFAQVDADNDGEVTSTEVLEYLNDNGSDYNGDEVISLQDALHEDSDFMDGIDNDNNNYTDDLFGWDFWASGSNFQNITQDRDPMEDATFHGTHVAGIAAAETNNNQGIAGAAYNATYMPIKAGGIEGFADAIGFGFEGIVYAAENDADIINCSWGGGSASDAEQDIINLATEMGALVISSSGNNAGRTGYPARYDNALAVGSVEEDDSRATYSNFGYNLDVLATGTDILSTESNNSYISQTGTSMSSPVVSGLAALVKDLHPNWSPERIGMQIRTSARYIDDANPGFEYQLGHGSIDANQALNNNFPGLKVISQEFINDQGDKLSLDEEGTIEITITNIGASSSNLQLQLSSLNESNVQLENSQRQLGSVATDDTLTLSFPITIPRDFDLTEIPTFHLEFADNSQQYNDFNIVVYEDMFFEIIAGNNVKTSFGAEGTWGFSDPLNGRGGVGFIPRYSDGTGGYNEGNNLLFEGGLMMEFNEELYDAVRSTAGQVSRDFFPKDAVTVLPTDDGNGLRGTTSFETNNDSSRRAQIDLETYAFDDPDISNVVFVKYTITNPSEFMTMKNTYVGLFNDWDLGNSSGNNNVSYSESDSLLYISDGASSSNAPTVAVAHLGPISGALAIDNTLETRQDSITFGIYDGFGNGEKSAALKAGTARTNVQNTDVSAVVSSGPYTLNPGATITVGFAYAFGDDLAELRNQIANARDRQLFETSPTGRISSDEVPEQTELFQNYPNPFNHQTEVRFDINEDSHVKLTLFDVLGRKVREIANQNFEAGSHFLTIDASNLSSGVYFIQLETDWGSEAIPVTKVRASQ